MNSTFKIIALVSQVDIKPAELDFCREQLTCLCGDARQQDVFFEYCLKWKMAPWMNIQLKKYSLSTLFTEDVQGKFEAVYQKVKLENEKRNAKALQFLKAFNDNGIDFIILKGNLFANTIYGNTGYKKMNDFDILIKREDWSKVHKIYLDLGFIPLGFGWSGEKEKETKFSHTAIPFISPDFTCIIGTQWGLKSPTTSFTINMQDAWDTALPFSFETVLCKQLSPAYNLLHLILHMGIYKCGIRDCMDVYNLLAATSWNVADTQALFDLIEKTGATEKARFTLEMCNLCTNTIPKAWLERMPVKDSSFISTRLKKRKEMFAETGDIHNSYNDYFQDIEKNVIYINLFPKFHHRLPLYGKILRMLYFPDIGHSLKFIDKFHSPTIANKIKGRIQGPWFSFAIIAEEVGWKVTSLLFVKLFFDVMLSPVNYVLAKDSYFDYLRKKNIDPAEIKKVVSNVQ
ncbi:nucleotidyltransferase family protein [Xanthocytophaga agilis]|uniref:Nucleotidyltransferase family protein n=1 Tax=Xanthocytophaga agilis TaxID=3048010 RepID=A0AAE3RDF0_9BACT|nr:nucleotidyltransferase family protein [Xanthocytophaga agilis]MDJ1505912.1 nucleotidyltransferase family protein [Xanthocytophaga agilis]